MGLPKALGWIIVAAVLTRLALFFVLDLRNDPQVFYLGDTKGYMQIASNIVAGNGFSQATSSPYTPDGMRTPVFPYVLATVLALFGTVIPYVVLQICMTVAIILIAYKLALHVTDSVRAALVVALLTGVEPYSIFISLTVLTETLFTLVLLGAVYLWCLYQRDRSVRALALSSLLFGVTALIRPITEFIPILLIVLILIQRAEWRRRLRDAVVLLACFALALSPWLVRNYITFGSPSLSTGGFQNVYSDLGATVISYNTGVPQRITKVQLNQRYADQAGIDVETIQQDMEQTPGIFREGVGILIAHPIDTVKTGMGVASAFFTNDAWVYYLQKWGFLRRYEFGFSPTYSLLTDGPVATAKKIVDMTGPTLIIPLTGRIFWVLSSALFFVGSLLMVLRGGYQRTVAVFFVGLVMYLFVLTLSAGAGSNGRYRYPINPLIYIAATVAVSRMVSRMRTADRKKLL